MSLSEHADDLNTLKKEVAENASSLEQLQLMKLCFYDHEFGISLNSHGSTNDEIDELSQDLDTDPGYVLEFDPLAFVESKISTGVPLEDLCRDLTFFEDLIRDKISHHVNTGMRNAFLSVSGYLVGMQEDLQCVQLPLEASIKRLNGASGRLLAATQSVQEKLERASTAEEERIFDIMSLRAMLSYEKIVDIMDGLMRDLTELSGTDNGALSQTDRLSGAVDEVATGSRGSPRMCRRGLERFHLGVAPQIVQRLEEVTTSMYQLNVMVSMLPALPSKQDIRAEVYNYAQESRSSVLAALRLVVKFLSHRFIESPQPRDIQSLQDVMKLYNVIGAQEEFCDMFSEAILYPHLENVLSWKAAAQARQSADEMVRLLQRLEEELRDAVIPLFPLMRRSFAGTSLFPVSKIMWPAVCKLLIEKLVALCDVGIPDSFHKRYVAAYRLLSLAEHSCISAEELVALRQSPDVALWNHKWNTDIYAVLRMTEMDKAIGAALMDLKNTTEMKVAIRNVLQVLFDQILWLFSEGVLLTVCIPKFIRKLDGSCKQVFRDVQKCITPSSIVTSSSETVAVCEQPHATDDMSLFFAAVTGASRVANLLEHSLLEQLKKHCEGSSSCVHSLANLLHIIRDSTCKAFIEYAQTQIIERVLSECVVGLQNIKTVRSAYSHTKKPPPTSSSWYVASIIDPIVRFVTAARGNNLPDNEAMSMLQTIAERVARQFTSIARDTLITAKKTEESWEKLRRRKDGAGVSSASTNNLAGNPRDSTFTSLPTTSSKSSLQGAPEALTDREKMLLQLKLDAKDLENKLVSLGTDYSMVSYLELTDDLLCSAELDADAGSPR
ncbi:unnamed protein product [Phytomonas sp. EM1]|nr:unnamed protein product [Phytomonas sp. EM1]|eukprot:CCW63269.1 unnamed protein product [Phytomonas sp. isolate EM1]